MHATTVIVQHGANNTVRLNQINKNKKEVGTTIKIKETSSKLSIYVQCS